MQNTRKQVKKVLASERGGIGTIIATVVSVILVLGLIAYTILGQVAGAKDVGDKGQVEQQKISELIHDQDTITGAMLKSYISQAIATGSIFTVNYTNTGGTKKTLTASGVMPTDIADSAIYSIEKKYSANGELVEITCNQKDLSKFKNP